MSTRLSPNEAHALLKRAPIVGVKEHPACVEFCFANGSRLVLYEGDREHAREWFEETSA